MCRYICIRMCYTHVCVCNEGWAILTTGGYPKCSVKSSVSEVVVVMVHRQSHRLSRPSPVVVN